MKRKKKPTQITSPFSGYFPVELFPEVLSKLPVKSLLRFRCLSKFWRNLIDNRDFISKHMIQYNEKNKHEKLHLLTAERATFMRLIFRTRKWDTFRKYAQHMVTRRCTDRDNFQTYWPFAGVDGLILLLSDPSNHMELCNPSIRKSLQIRRPPLVIGPKSLYAVGFSSLVNDHKVVAFQFRTYGKYEKAFAVYGLNDGKWRRRTRGMDVIDWSDCFMQRECVATKGAAHWLIGYDKERDPIDGNVYTHIASFNFDAEEFSVVELPGDEGEMLWFPFVLCELIAVFGISRVRSCIWVMDKDGGKKLWNRWYSGDSNSNGYDFFHRRRDSKILYFEKSHEFLITKHYWNLSWYNIRSLEWRRMLTTYTETYDVYTHVESLLLSTTLDAQTMTSLL